MRKLFSLLESGKRFVLVLIIGAALWITEHTVKQALKRMFRKLEVSSRAELVARIAKFSNKLAAS
jgi:DNA-binding NarL/FixJ family response regulator